MPAQLSLSPAKVIFLYYVVTYSPTGSNPAGLTCMELTLKSLEVLTCKNVGLGPRERAYFETSGSGVWIHIAVKIDL